MPAGQPALSERLDALLAEIPDEAITMSHEVEDGLNRVTITIDWLFVPGEAMP
jgi:hypothetical protein